MLSTFGASDNKPLFAFEYTGNVPNRIHSLASQLGSTTLLEPLLNLLPHLILVRKLDLLEEVGRSGGLVLSTDVLERRQVVADCVLAGGKKFSIVSSSDNALQSLRAALTFCLLRASRR